MKSFINKYQLLVHLFSPFHLSTIVASQIDEMVHKITFQNLGAPQIASIESIVSRLLASDCILGKVTRHIKIV